MTRFYFLHRPPLRVETLLQQVVIPDHALAHGRQTAHVSELTREALKQIVTETIVPVAIRRDLQSLVAVGTLWGNETLRRVRIHAGLECRPEAIQARVAVGCLPESFDIRGAFGAPA